MAKRDADVTLRLGADLIARLDEHRAEIARRQPGLEPSRSAAARSLLLRGLERVEQ